MRVFYLVVLVVLLGIYPSSSHAGGLSLDEAVSLASLKDPALQQFENKALALDEKSVADGQLNDPKVKFAFQSFPTSDLSYTREGMTQVVAGVSQALPKGRTLKYKAKKTSFMAMGERARYQDKKRQIKLAVQQSWLDIYYWQQASNTVDESEILLKEVIQATESAYSTGRQNSQDIISAELELSVLEDKRIDINRHIETSQAELGTWIGTEAAKRRVVDFFPELGKISSYGIIQKKIVGHPKIKIADAMVDVQNNGVKLAQEQYKPGFNLGLNYGLRNGRLANGDDRPDFVTAMVTLDVPLFTKKRQDKKLSSSKYQAASAQFMRDDALRNLNATLEKEYANWQRLRERAKHYETDVIKRSEENFEASLRAYQEDLTDFSSLMRAQVMELNTKLQWMKLKTDQAKAQAKLLYLQGENL